MIRKFTPQDTGQLVDLFAASIRATGSAYYSPEEVEAWASWRPDTGSWEDFFAECYTLVDEREGIIAGFGCLHGDGSFIDMLFTRHAHQNKGTGSALIRAMEEEALRLGHDEIFLTTSATAWKFYQKRGYHYFTSKKQLYGNIEFDCQILRKALPVFPAMRRGDRTMENEKARELLRNGEYGLLSVCSINGYGYGVPLNYALSDESIYFHCALEGFKMENIRYNNRVSFCVTGRTHILPERFTTLYESVLVFGRITVELSDAERMKALELLVQKYSPQHVAASKDYIHASFHKTRVLRLDMEHLSGKERTSK
ncbi:MAG: GNAT family N-acetyltransferase [Bacteroidales bacterium]|jgi:nitroimidazol reductase NimA-like FMN-containing flavoprotein (pyridoxamine 5'-phosphate oxidase superfamily)/GNAT superfamily N-acetyltransferase|nr:GNAT family N-acetyltransferase [Bacteroidales bacterium]